MNIAANSMSWTDTHCHLEDGRYRPVEESGGASRDHDLGGTEGVLKRARDAGVGTFITVGCDRESSLAAIDCAGTHDDVWATVGLHPHEAEHGVATLDGLFDRPRVIAVGEAGLDYFYEHSPREAQREAFAAQIQIAHDRKLPLVIHTRDAWEETFDILRAERPPAGIIFHCFTGGVDEAKRCLDLGSFLSFSGIVTFKNATDVAAAARMCPDERILVETDSPYLAPVPHRGRTNQPAHVADVGRFVADLRHTATRDFADLTSANARIAFPRSVHNLESAMLSFAERRRLVLAIAVTAIAIVVAMASGDGDGASSSTVDTVPTSTTFDDDAPADPAFLPETESSGAPQIITVNVPAPPSGTVITGTASYIRWPQTMGLKPCATPHALIGAVITVTNLNNGRQIKCNNVSIEALRDDSVILIHTDVFLDLADLVDAPIPVEINF